MKKIILTLFIGSTIFLSCSKTEFEIPFTKPCLQQTGDPTGKSYTSDSVVAFNCPDKHCGVLQMSAKNYWVYEDSLFIDGVFDKVQLDTLRFSSNKQSLADGLVWWEGNLNVGLPLTLYTNDSSFFGLSERLFTPGYMDVKKEFGLFVGDSVKYLTSFEDAAATGLSKKIHSALKTPAGDFNECIYFEKLARNYRKDQVYYKPGVGVMRYVQEKAPMGTRILKLQQVSTLVDFHIE